MPLKYAHVCYLPIRDECNLVFSAAPPDLSCPPGHLSSVTTGSWPCNCSLWSLWPALPFTIHSWLFAAKWSPWQPDKNWHCNWLGFFSRIWPVEPVALLWFRRRVDLKVITNGGQTLPVRSATLPFPLCGVPASARNPRSPHPQIPSQITGQDELSNGSQKHFAHFFFCCSEVLAGVSWGYYGYSSQLARF